MPATAWLRRRDQPRAFRGVLVHPTQEMRDPDGAFFRGGPEWPRFHAQILARHCRGLIPRPIDAKPLPAIAEWPYFDPAMLPVFWPHLGIDQGQPPAERQRAVAEIGETLAPLPHQDVDKVEAGIWCGPIHLHFGETIAAWGMRIAASARLGRPWPLVFSLPPFREAEPRPFFWDMLDHLQVDRRRVLLIRTPTRFERLQVLPQAERLYGGGPTRRHLDLLDEITGGRPVEQDVDCLFVSRSQLPDGYLAAESYLDEALTAAGVTVLHPETTDLHTQLLLYRRARRLIFSEGSALHALQLLGRLDSDLVVLVRRPGYRIARASLRPRTRSLRYIEAKGLVYGLSRSGHTMLRAGITVLDEKCLLTGLKTIGVDLGPVWDSRAYKARLDEDIGNWLARRRTPDRHPADAAVVERRLRQLSLRAPGKQEMERAG